MGAAAPLEARPRGVEGVLVRLRVPDHMARLLAATPSLRWSWFSAAAIAAGFAAWAAHAGPRGLLVFLAVAPLLPVGGVAAAFGPWSDPAHDLAQASPTASFSLVMIRSTAVLAATVGIGGIVATFLPGTDWIAVAWVLPSFALTIASLAL